MAGRWPGSVNTQPLTDIPKGLNGTFLLFHAAGGRADAAARGQKAANKTQGAMATPGAGMGMEWKQGWEWNENGACCALEGPSPAPRALLTSPMSCGPFVQLSQGWHTLHHAAAPQPARLLSGQPSPCTRISPAPLLSPCSHPLVQDAAPCADPPTRGHSFYREVTPRAVLLLLSRTKRLLSTPGRYQEVGRVIFGLMSALVDVIG